MRYEQTIRKLKHRLHEHFGNALKQVIVFGSVARDAVTMASDIDVMIILDDDMTEVNWRVEDAIIDIAYPLELEDDVVFDLKVMGKHDIQGKFRYMPFIEHIMKEGIPV
jgi:predicted nucleotidyltransferase